MSSPTHCFTANILLKSLLYLASIPVAGFTIMSVYYLLGGITDELLQIMPNYTTSRQLISTVLYVFFCILLINFLLQVNRKFGPGNLWKFIAGKYHTPKDENRIFMFVDLKGSTTMAEQLGHNIYSQLIQDCFYELSQVVPRYKAEIYQYVGDEAVLTWPLKEGMENLNFLRVYFAFEQRLERRRKYYLARFGVFPEFKAGVEMGSVTVAEVGEIKREIAYHGDVLNTASRIQACCNQYGKQLLVSDRLQHVLGGQQEFAVQHVGKLLLRGKKQEVDILSVEQAAAARKEARPDQVAKG